MSPAFYSMFIICFHIYKCVSISMCVFLSIYTYIERGDYSMILRYFKFALVLINLIQLWYVLRACKKVLVTFLQSLYMGLIFHLILARCWDRPWWDSKKFTQLYIYKCYRKVEKALNFFLLCCHQERLFM